MGRLVWVAGPRSGSAAPVVVHSSPSCDRLSRSDPVEKDEDVLGAETDECGWCFGGGPPSGEKTDPFKFVGGLLAADPDEYPSGPASAGRGGGRR